MPYSAIQKVEHFNVGLFQSLIHRFYTINYNESGLRIDNPLYRMFFDDCFPGIGDNLIFSDFNLEIQFEPSAVSTCQ